MRSPTSALAWLVAVVWLACATPSAYAAEPEWSDAFPKTAVDSYLGRTGVRVMVVSAGVGTESEDASRALLDAFRALSSVKSIMPDDALGTITETDDASIVARTKGMPLDLVAIVRVFPGKSGSPEAVVTLYRPDGSIAAGFTGSPSIPLGMRDLREPVGGMTGQAGGVVERVVENKTVELEARVKEFEERAVWREGHITYIEQTGRVVKERTELLKGRYGDRLRGYELYAYVGRQDLADEFRKRNTVVAVSRWSGAGLLTISVLAILTTPDAQAYPGSPRFVLGFAGAVVGGGGLLVPAFYKAHPVSEKARTRLVDEYNDALRKELELPRSTGQTEPSTPVSVGAWFAGDGGGVSIAGTF